jgi:cytochrome P450
MRYISMSSAQPRMVAKDFDWRGHMLKENDIVMMMIAGGNRDPRVFTNPETLDLNRATDKALTFGPGMHHCIGHMLAKLQMGEFFTAVTQRFERVEVMDEPEWVPNIIFRAVNGLNVRFYPRVI